MLETNTVATVHQRLRDEHDVRVSVTSLRRYVWQAFPDRSAPAATVLRRDVPAGLEAQIDYGYLGRWLDPVGGRIRRVWAFVVVLAHTSVPSRRAPLRPPRHPTTTTRRGRPRLQQQPRTTHRTHLARPTTPR
jgi:hypothetical protein